MKKQFYLLDLEMQDNGKQNLIRLYGRDKEGKRVIYYDKSMHPYFYIIPEKKAIINNLKKKIEEDKEVYEVKKENKSYLGEERDVLKITCLLNSEAIKVKDIIKKWKGVEYKAEVDIPLTKKYLIEKNINVLQLVEAEIEENEIKSIIGTGKYLEPKMLSFDIETYLPSRGFPMPSRDPAICIGIYGNKFKKVITWKKFTTDNEDYIFANSEKEMIEEFLRQVEKYDPDYIVGYFSDGFDFPYLRDRADKLKVKFELNGAVIEVGRRGNFPKTKILGIVHIDLNAFVRLMMTPVLETDTYDLDSVARELVGEGKEEIEMKNLGAAWDHGGKAIEPILEYNMQDVKITYKLAEKLLPNIHEISKVVGQSPFDVSRHSYGLQSEWFLIKKAHDYNELVPNHPSEENIRKRMKTTFKAAFVFTPEPGLYENIAVFDFKGLYPSIIAAHNISATTLGADGNETIPVETITGKLVKYHLSKKQGFITKSIIELIEARNKIKKEMKGDKTLKGSLLGARNYALKTIANAMYGYHAFFGARWYSLEAAQTITAYARHYITTAMDLATKEGFKVIYGDTDSIMLHLNKQSKKLAEDFQKKVNDKLPRYMELELEDYYTRGIFVMRKGKSEFGAKKKYALINERGKIKIIGFETVRRDWSKLARETQEKVLGIILRENNSKKAMEYAREVIELVEKRKIKMEDMIMRTKLKKPIDSYASEGPHVAAAKRMRDKGLLVGTGTMIEYVVSGKGTRIRDKVKLPQEIEDNDYDSEYYINNQVLPAVEKILEVLGYTKEEILHGKTQTTLGSFGKKI